MNRLLKPLSFALALLLVLALFPISARAVSYDGMRSQNSTTAPTDTGNPPAEGGGGGQGGGSDQGSGGDQGGGGQGGGGDQGGGGQGGQGGVNDDNQDDYWTGYVEQDIDKSKLQTKYDITLVSKPAAQDKMDGTVDLRLYLAYQGNQDLNDAPISYIRVEPVIPEDTKNFPFELDSSSYVKDFADLIDVRDEDGEIVERGTFRELMDRNGIFAEIYRMQTAEADDDEAESGAVAAEG